MSYIHFITRLYCSNPEIHNTKCSVNLMNNNKKTTANNSREGKWCAKVRRIN